MPIRSRSLSTQPNKFKDSFVYLWLSMFRNVCDGVTCSATKWLVIGGTGILYMGWYMDTKHGTSMICNVWYDVICIATKLTGHTCIANTKDVSFRISHVWWLMSCVQTRAIYKKSPRGAASGMSRCHFFGWLLMSLLSFYHMQLGWIFNMLVSDLGGVNWLWPFMVLSQIYGCSNFSHNLC